MTLSSRIRIAALSLTAAAAVLFGAGWAGYTASAEPPPYVVHAEEPTLLAQADTGSAADLKETALAPDLAAPAPATDAGSAAPAETTPAAEPPQLEASDVGVITKLYKNGAFFGLGIMVVFVGLSIWSKLDKKRAFYAATLLGGVGLLVESIRRGDTPNVTMLFSTLAPMVGILIAGPNHVKAPKAGEA